MLVGSDGTQVSLSLSLSLFTPLALVIRCFLFICCHLKFFRFHTYWISVFICLRISLCDVSFSCIYHDVDIFAHFTCAKRLKLAFQITAVFIYVHGRLFVHVSRSVKIISVPHVKAEKMKIGIKWTHQKQNKKKYKWKRRRRKQGTKTTEK